MKKSAFYMANFWYPNQIQCEVIETGILHICDLAKTKGHYFKY